MLPAYELGILKAETEFAFEKHLLECDCCHRALDELMPYLLFIKSDEKVKTSLMLETERAFSGPGASRSKKPPANGPVLRSVMLSSLIFLLSVTCLLLLFQTKEAIKTVQHISLAPLRSAEPATLISSLGTDAVISFYYPRPDTGRLYNLAIIDFRGDTIMAVDNYKFGQTPTGHIYFPHSEMRPGQYELIIFDSADSASGALKTYTFHIAE